MRRGIATLALLSLGTVIPALAADPQAIAVIHPTRNNKVEGTVRFDWVNEHEVKVVVDVKGLKPNTEHGFHIHEFGDVSANDGKSAGGHFNPRQHKHAGPKAANRHAGDLGNLKSDASGKAHLELTMSDLSLFGQDGILGRAVVIHADKDDFKTQPTGNSGDRVGVGVIGLSK
ncbi:superoxide dismutase family protein [bacterium]|nr:superoxide dismutase family protein [bacterium]